MWWELLPWLVFLAGLIGTFAIYQLRYRHHERSASEVSPAIEDVDELCRKR